MSRITTKFAREQIEWLNSQAQNLGTTAEAIVTMLVTEAARPNSFYQRETEATTQGYLATPLVFQILSCTVLSYEERHVLVYLISHALSELETLDGIFDAQLDIKQAAEMLNMPKGKVFEASQALFKAQVITRIRNTSTGVRVDLRALWAAEKEIYQALLRETPEARRSALEMVENALFTKEGVEETKKEALEAFFSENHWEEEAP